jgi:transcriptional regulator with XRE-family HTH domain
MDFLKITLDTMLYFAIICYMRTLVDNLNTYRLDNRLSQQQLAKVLKVAFCTVNRWFRGRHSPNMIQEHHIEKLLSSKYQVPSSKRKTTQRRGK